MQHILLHLNIFLHFITKFSCHKDFISEDSDEDIDNDDKDDNDEMN